LLAYLYVHYVIFLPTVMHMHMKLKNSFGNWLIMQALRSFQKTTASERLLFLIALITASVTLMNIFIRIIRQHEKQRTMYSYTR